jgi:hypothetical protein
MNTKKEKTNYIPPRLLARTVALVIGSALLVPLGSTSPPDKDKKVSSDLVIPSGTVLPVRLETTLSSSKSQTGQRVTARIMQDVPLPHGSKIREGSKVLGHIVEKTDPAQGGPASISVQFDTLVSSYGTTKLTTSLRAIAGLGEVLGARTPQAGEGEGDVWNWRNTTQIGGDVVYGVGGPVTSDGEVVGTSVASGVLGEIRAKPGSKCRGPIDGNQNPQALWLFSSDACGAYGLSHAQIAHAGRSNPVGVIVLTSGRGKVMVQSGAGMLLRVAGTPG